MTIRLQLDARLKKYFKNQDRSSTSPIIGILNLVSIFKSATRLTIIRSRSPVDGVGFKIFKPELRILSPRTRGVRWELILSLLLEFRCQQGVAFAQSLPTAKYLATHVCRKIAKT